MENALVILEPSTGAHHLKVGDYYFDEDLNTIFVGIGDLTFGPGGSPTGIIEIRANGIYDVSQFAQAIVAVSSVMASKRITENGLYLPEDEGLQGYNAVLVDVSGMDTMGVKTGFSISASVGMSADVEIIT